MRWSESLAEVIRPTQGKGPWSAKDYRNGSDIDSDNFNPAMAYSYRKLVNGYVLPNLFYELMILDEHGVDVSEIDWADDAAVSRIIRQFESPRLPWRPVGLSSHAVVADCSASWR